VYRLEEPDECTFSGEVLKARELERLTARHWIIECSLGRPVPCGLNLLGIAPVFLKHCIQERRCRLSQ
jgi:hypothetical protein